ncbi:hypothetical protein Tco_0784921 [Tanacetum coccineum]
MGQAYAPKQALRGMHPMLILVLSVVVDASLVRNNVVVVMKSLPLSFSMFCGFVLFCPGCPGFLKPLVLSVFVLRSQELLQSTLHLEYPWHTENLRVFEPKVRIPDTSPCGVSKAWSLNRKVGWPELNRYMWMISTTNSLILRVERENLEWLQNIDPMVEIRK